MNKSLMRTRRAVVKRLICREPKILASDLPVLDRMYLEHRTEHSDSRK